MNPTETKTVDVPVCGQKGKFGLAADVGGTNVRFALVDLAQRGDARLVAPRALVSKDHPTIVDAALAYLDNLDLASPPEAAALAVAGPVGNGAISLTNLNWHFSADDFGAALGIGHVRLINDYEAIAQAAPHFGDGDLREIGKAAPPLRDDGSATVAIVGPGTGLGVGGYVRSGHGIIPLVTEGGHANFAPADDTEIAILQFLRRRFGHVSTERILSGPGLCNLHEAMSTIDGVAYEPLSAHAITDKAAADPTSFCARVFKRFCAIMGSVCGDVALVMGARGGILIAGGILPAMADIFAASAFRERFEAKGRFADYLKKIPTHLIVQPYAGLMGSARVLADDNTGAA